MAQDIGHLGAGHVHDAHHDHAHHGPRTLPSVLSAPDVVLAWRMRAAYSTPEQTWNAYMQGLISHEQQICINQKHTMLSPTSAIVQFIIVFAFLGGLITLLNRWSIARDADPAAGTARSFDRWRVMF